MGTRVFENAVVSIPGNVLDIITVAMVGRLGWYDSQYPVALSACLGGKGVRSEATVSRSRRELSNEYLLDEIGVDTAENEPLEVWGQIQFIIHSPPYTSRTRGGCDQLQELAMLALTQLSI